MPRGARWLVERAVGPDEAEDVLGDLLELAGGRRGLGRRVWMLHQAVRLYVRSVTHGPRRVPRPGSAHGDSGWIGDLKFAVRSYARTPVLAGAILATLALGIGATTAIFSVVDAVLIRPLPFPDPDRLVLVWEREPHDGLLEPFSPPNLADARAAIAGLAGLGGWVHERYAMTGVGEPEQILAVRVTADFFPVLGAGAAHGRVFDPGTDADRATVVLAHGFWVRRFGADPNVVGRTLTLDDRSYQVVGVMPRSFSFPDDPEVAVWMPLVRFPWEEIRHTRNTRAIARLADGVSLASVRQEAEAVAVRLSEAHPDTNGGYGMVVQPASALAGDHRSLLMLLGAVALVLLIACANVANLLLARASDRERELAVRRSLGASRARILRQLMVESGVLAALGATLGLGVAWAGVRLLVSMEPGSLPSWNPVGLNAHVLGFALGVTIFVTVAAGFIPALRASRQGTLDGLHGGASRVGGDRSGRRTRSALSGFEVALAVVLLAGGGLLMASLVRLVGVDPGFRADGLLTATVELPETRYQYGSGEMERTFEGILAAVRGQPRIEEAGWVTTLPMNPVGTDYDIEFYLPETPDRTPVDAPVRADFRVASAGYFEALGVPLLRGRTISDEDRADARPVAVVNQTLADRFFPGEDPLGRRIQVYAPEGDGFEIAGVVGDVRHRGLDDQPRPEIYLPYRQMTHGEMTLVARYTGDMAVVVGGLRRAVAEVDPALPLIAVADVPTLLRDSMAERRFYMTLLVGFALVGLLLAAVGVYGTLSFAVNRRRHEIGIRMAIGAGRSQVVRMVVSQGLGIVAGGLAVGLLGAFFLTRTLRGLLFGVEPGDPATLGGVALVVASIALLACWLPAHRASRVEPTRALRDG